MIIKIFFYKRYFFRAQPMNFQQVETLPLRHVVIVSIESSKLLKRIKLNSAVCCSVAITRDIITQCYKILLYRNLLFLELR